MTARRIVYTPEHVQRFRNALAEARADLRESHSRFLAEIAELRREVAELRSIMQDVVRASRVKAADDVASLRHELETALARLERRDPALPLH